LVREFQDSGLNRRAFARKIGVHPLTVSRWIRSISFDGTQQPPIAPVTSAPKLAAEIEENIPQGLVVHAFPKTHQQRLRTTNPLERINQELKRRTRVARVCPNEASLLRLVSALPAEIAEEWETGKIYLNVASPNPQAN